MFRWKRGLLHALIPFGLALAAGLVLLVVTDPVDPEKLGEGVGRFAAACYVAGLGISYLAQTGKKRGAIIASAALIAVVGALVVVSIGASADRPHVTARDRAPLREVTVDGVPRLQHPTLGFTILRPPASYHESPAAAAAMGVADPDTVSYAYAEEPPQGGLVVSVLYGAHDLAESVHGVEHGLEAAMKQQAGPDAKLEYVRNTIAPDEAHVHAIMNGALHIQINAYALRDRDAIAMVMVVATSPTQLADVLASFRR